MTRKQSIVINFWCSILPYTCTTGWNFCTAFRSFHRKSFFFDLLASVGAQIPFSIELKLLRRNQSLFYTYLRSVELYRVLKLWLYQCFDFHISFPTKTFSLQVLFTFSLRLQLLYSVDIWTANPDPNLLYSDGSGLLSK